MRDVALLCGQRPRVLKDGVSGVWYLSPYEFVTYWEPVLLKYPWRVDENKSEECHATLTASGHEKVRSQSRNGEGAHDTDELVSGEEYVVKASKHRYWLPFPETPATEVLRRQRILHRGRPLRSLSQACLCRVINLAKPNEQHA